MSVGKNSSSSDFNPGLHQWQSQDLFLEELEVKFEDVDPLNFKKVKYHKHEWDNIPPVVPKFIVNLSKYVEGLSAICHDWKKEERTSSIREFTQAQLAEVKNSIQTIDQSRLSKEMEFLKNLQAVSDFGQNFRKDYSNFQQSLYYSRSLFEGQTEEQSIVTAYMRYLGDAYDQAKNNSPPTTAVTVDEEWENKKQIAVNTPRLISIQGFQRLFDQYGQRSTIQHQLDSHKRQIGDIVTENIKQQIVDKDLANLIIALDKKTLDSDNAMKHAQELVNDDVEQRLQLIFKTLEKHQDELKQQKDFSAKTRTLLENLQFSYNNSEKRFRTYCIETKKTIEDNKDDFIEQITATNTRADELELQMTKELSFSRKSAMDQTKCLEVDLTDKFSRKFDNVEQYLNTSLTKLSNQTNKSSDTITKSLKNIKEVCTHYFTNYEDSLEEVKIRTHLLENKYSDWSKLLIEPTTINEARLFALETRVNEEEDMRIKEYDFLRDLMRKLLYSLEQSTFDSLDGTQIIVDGKQTKIKTQLPNLLQHATPDKGGKVPDLNQSQEVIMLKRLNFLKSSLDQHDPKDTTARMRQIALQKRDERVYELWKKDTEAPSVQEMISKSRETKSVMRKPIFGADGSSIGNHNSSDGSQERELYITNNISIMSQDEVKVQTSRALGIEQNSIFSTANASGSQARTVRVGKSLLKEQENSRNSVSFNKTQWQQRHKSLAPDQKTSKIVDNLSSMKFTTSRDTEAEEKRLKEKRPSKVPHQLFDPLIKDRSAEISFISKQLDQKQRAI